MESNSSSFDTMNANSTPCNALQFDPDVVRSTLSVAESTGVRENSDYLTALLYFLSTLLSPSADSICIKRILQLLVSTSTVPIPYSFHVDSLRLDRFRCPGEIYSSVETS